MPTRIRRAPWSQHPAHGATIHPELLAYRPRIVISPTSRSAALVNGQALSLVGDASVGFDSFRFGGADGYIDWGSQALVNDSNHTVLISSRLSSFVNSFPMMARYATSTSARLVAYSSTGNYTDVAWYAPGSPGTRYDLAKFGSIAGTRHNLVLRQPGVYNTGASQGWCNGSAIVASVTTSTAGDSGNNRIGQRGSDTQFDFAGNIWLFALFDSVLPESWCLRLSLNPYAIFAPRIVWVPVSAAGAAPTLTAASVTQITRTSALPRVSFTR